MPNFLGLLPLLQQRQERPKVGRVVKQTTGGLYKVKVAGREIFAKLGTTESLAAGDRIVLNKTESGLFIVGKGETESQDIVEVLING